jgi:asparagine synthase (glutamine-hydrolysing)
MCGICGVYFRDPARPVSEPALRAMRDALAHRGPDGAAVLIDGAVGLGHRRLSIIDLDGGAQPIWNEDETACVILNGEIYNYLELRAELQARGHRFRTRSDAEVIVHLYEERGEACVESLNGMFALAVWDRRARALLLARDPFGIKPLYLLHDGAGLRFASEIKALLAFEGRRAEPDPYALADYAIFQYPLGERTFFRDIRNLPPGTVLRYGRTGQVARTYWSVPMETDPAAEMETSAAALRELLEDSVRLQLRSDVPVGCHLSGGVDTATITCLATQRLGRPPHTFTLGFDEGDIYDDRAHARITAEKAGTIHHETVPCAEDLAAWLPRLMWFLDQPVAGPGLVPQFFVSRLAKQWVKVVLGGHGADEMIGGYARHYLWCLDQHLAQRMTGGSLVSSLTLPDLLPGLRQLRSYMPLVRLLFADGVGGDPASRYFALIRRQRGLDAVFHPEFIASLGGYDPYDTYREIFDRHPRAELLNRVLYFETTATLPALLQVEDRMSMACSLESRVPFLDRRVAELVFRLPASVKLAGGQTKAVLRRAMQGVVPGPILDRPDKIGFPVPLDVWRRGPLLGFVRDCLLDGRSTRRGLFRPGLLESAIADDSPATRQMWGLLSLETWFRTFVDVDAPAIGAGPPVPGGGEPARVAVDEARVVRRG